MNELDFQGADMVGLSSKRIGDILIQATTSESYDDTLSITSHPVESGPYGNSVISDHAYKQPLTVTLKCGWSNASYEALLGARAMDVANGKAAADDYATAIYLAAAEPAGSARADRGGHQPPALREHAHREPGRRAQPGQLGRCS